MRVTWDWSDMDETAALTKVPVSPEIGQSDRNNRNIDIVFLEDSEGNGGDADLNANSPSTQRRGYKT